MKHLPFPHVLLIASCLMSASCDRQKLLLKDKERVEAENQQAIKDTQAIEQRILALGTQVASAEVHMERQAAGAEQKAAMLQAEIVSLKGKVKALDDTAKLFGPKVDSYKAKYLR